MIASLGKRFGDNAYAAEELIAELGAAFTCAHLGLSTEPREDHAQYLESWLRVLKADSRAIFTAASKAQQATDWLIARAGESARAGGGGGMTSHRSSAYVKAIGDRGRAWKPDPITNQFRFIVRMAYACHERNVPYDLTWDRHESVDARDDHGDGQYSHA